MKKIRNGTMIILILAMIMLAGGLQTSCSSARRASAKSYMIQDAAELSRNKKFKKSKAYKKSVARRKVYAKKHHRK